MAVQRQEDTPQSVAPRRQIRRFDVFAEFNRQKNLERGMPDKYAKGDALWVAKVVASRGGGVRSRLHHTDHGAADAGSTSSGEQAPHHEWSFKTLGGEVQSDAQFDNEVVKRMGREFYERVFEPAIARAIAAGSRYEDIRDTVRSGWNEALRQQAESTRTRRTAA